MTGGKELRVDPERLLQAGYGFPEAANAVPDPPEQYIPEGSDPLTARIAALAPEVAASVQQGLPELKRQGIDFANKVIMVAKMYAGTDEEQKHEIDPQMHPDRNDRPSEAPGDDKPAPWPWDHNTVPGKPKHPLTGVLDGQAWQIARNSPVLLEEWQRLKNEKWQIQFEPNQGTYTDYHRNGNNKVINIDPELKKDPEQFVDALTHEMGHALYGPPVIDRSTRASCIGSQLDNEGAATMNSIKVERDILAHGGFDIIPPSVVDDKFEAIYGTYLKAGSTNEAYQAAIGAIGREFGALTPSTAPGSTYNDYYGGGCPR
jgi:hypothetical protein